MMDVPGHAGAIHTTQELGKTGAPLVIKGVERIESINLPGEDRRREAELFTHAISRIMRRDFNLTSVKLFWYTRGYTRRNVARRMLQDLTDEAQRLEDIALRYERPAAAPAATCTMRIITDESETLFDALITADRALYKLTHSPMAEVAEENMGPFLRCFTALRKEVFGFHGDQRQDPSAQGRESN